jgi:Protein of unknown function, DUF488
MIIYTSYYSRLNRLHEAGIVPVSISLKVPPGVNVLKYLPLAPTPSILYEHKDNPDLVKYTHRYFNEVLGILNPYQVVADLLYLTNNSNRIALLCYESPSKFCHRTLVARWLNMNVRTLILPVEEFTI